MKIIIINQQPQDVLGGSEVQCDIIATYLIQFGHEVIYLAVNGNQKKYEVPYQVISVKNLNPLHLYRIIKNIQPDVIYWRYDKNQLLTSALISKLNKSKFVYSISHYNNSQVWVASGHTIFYRFLDRIKKANNFFTIIRSFRALLDPITSAINYIAVPLMVDGIVSNNSDSLIKIPDKKKISIHNSMYLETSNFHWPKPYIAWVANLKSTKNPENFYRLAKELEDTGVDFLMAGKIQDKYYNYLLTVGERQSNFHYIGPKSPFEVNGILKNALFMVHTCNPEGFPGNMIQAWLQGKPVISLFYDPEGTIERESIGYFSRTFPQFVEHTRFLIENEQTRTMMGHKAKLYVQLHFDPLTNVKKLESFLTDIITD